MKTSVWPGALTIMGLVGIVACGGTTTTGVATRGGATGGDDGAGGKGATSAGGAGGNSVFGAGGRELMGTGGDGDACVSTVYPIRPLPTGRYVMFDQSSAVGDSLPGGTDTWWTAAERAWTGFLGNAASPGHFVGIQYFPLPEPDSGTSCSASYTTPDVELALLPDNATALASSFGHHGPATAETPTGPAFEGAIDHMKAWASVHPDRAPVVVLVMASLPTACTAQGISDLATLAKFAYDWEPKIRTRVIALNLGSKGHMLDPIAKAGGTVEAAVIQATDVVGPLEEALQRVPGAAGGCSLDVPKPMTPSDALDPNLIDVRYTPDATGITRHVSKLNNLGECSAVRGEGWYYDSPTAPTKIETCPEICSEFDLGVVEVVRGCMGGTPIPPK